MSRNKSLIFLGIICLLLNLTALLTGIALYNALTSASPWRIHRIEITGNKHLTPGDIYNALGIPYGASIWWYSLPDLAMRLKNHPWIREAFVRWDFPNVLSVQIVERQPFVTLCCNECYYIDNFGLLFDKCNECGLTSWVVKAERCDEVVFSWGSKRYLRLEFFQRLSALLKAVAGRPFPVKSPVFNYDAERGFFLNVGNTRIFLGFEDFDRRLRVARKIMQKIQPLYGNDAKVEIDVRYRRKAYVRPCITDGKDKNGTQS